MRNKKIYVLIIFLVASVTLIYFSLYLNKPVSQSTQKNVEKVKVNENSKKEENKNSKIEDNGINEKKLIFSNLPDKIKDKSVATQNVSSKSASSKKEKVWVEPVYKTVYHPTETQEITKFKCECGDIFDSIDSWKKHKPKD
ncbi:MAG: hypothetical protein PUI85_03010 [Eubacteriales bacterium]|nr:hypothetical protein [Eubacteriales bacterium]MDY3333169.1 hypothetical protein [Gallibacter sp.]